MRHPERRFFANLDALRFLAFFAVFVSHVVTIAGPEVFAHPLHQRLLSFTHLGFLGVDFFFVLSSFLITWIVLEEYQHTGGFAVGRFWIRRTLRIWPLYFLIVLPVYSAKWLGWELLANQPDFVWAATFTLNFWMAAHGHQFLLALGVLWSISVEEQFYFAWALALKKAKRQLPLLSGLLIAVSLVATVLLRNQGDHPYFNTLPFLQHFGVGALVA
jgi:peptidoglycan/LPS O-acetylase OafA/YrhL